MMPVLSVALNSSYQVLEEILINLTPFMVMNQLNHQEIETVNLHQLPSNTEPLLSKPVLWFQLSWGDLIKIPLTMVILVFTLQSFQFDLTMNMFQIETPLQSNQFIMIKFTISYNSSTCNRMMIFWMLTSILFRLE